MKVENRVQPNAENIRALLSGEEEPVVMVNLLKFRDKAPGF